MDNGSRFVNGIMLDEYFISAFLDMLTRKVNSDNANFILQKLASGDIDFLELLGEIGSKKEITKLEKRVKYFERELKNTQERKDEFYKKNRDLDSKNRQLQNDLYNYISALRYYEDHLEQLGLRQEILRRKDLGKIFNDDDEEAYWE